MVTTVEIKKWRPDNFSLETNTVWNFPERGDWATHDAKYRGNWSPYIPRNIILRYSDAGDWILDQFAGGGTTLIEAKLLNRNIIGIDVNESALISCRKKCDFDCENAGRVEIRKGDARHLSYIKDHSIDLICTHPPYADIIRYSDGIEADLSQYKLDDFLEQMILVAAESYRVLKKGKYCALLIGDTRQRGAVVPLGNQVMRLFERTGFKIKEIIIKTQHNCSSTPYWMERSKKYNFLLLAHEYLLVFKK